MARSRSKAVDDAAILSAGRREIPAEDESQEEEAPTTSKAEAVRAGMAEGLTKPGDIQEFVKSRFGLDIPKPQISSYAAQQRARQAKAESPRAQSSGIPQGFSSDVKELRGLIEKVGGSDELRELIGQMAGLLGKYGATGLNELIDALG